MTISFKAYVPGEGTYGDVAEAFQFPGGEWHLRNIHTYPNRRVTWIADVRGADPNDLVKAALLASHAAYWMQTFVLMLPYLPAARADRGTPKGAAAYAWLANSLGAQSIIAVDGHSEAGVRPYNNVIELDATAFIDRALMGRTYDAVIAPDDGALYRGQAMAQHLGCKLIRASKERDFATGRIIGMRMLDATPKDWRYLVVDDICDGGGTFVGLAEMLNLPTDQLDLWITHGIFSGKAGQLHDHYGRIYTTDSHPGAYTGEVRPFAIVPTFPIMFNAMRNGLSK